MSIMTVVKAIDEARARNHELSKKFSERCDDLIGQIEKMKAGFLAEIAARDADLVAMVGDVPEQAEQVAA